MYKHILVPVDDSILAIHTVSHAVEFARSVGARLTFFHVVADYANSSEGALMHVIDPAVFSTYMAGCARTVLQKAEIAARIGQVPSGSLHAASDRPYEAILQEAQAQGCDLIFMASHGNRGLSRLMIGSQTLKVLAEANVPVLVDSSETRSVRPAMTRALGIILDEHRTLGVLLLQLQILLQDASGGAPVDFALLRPLLTYLREFRLPLHHSKEHSFLFRLLKRRSDGNEQPLKMLEQYHEDEPQRVARLVAAFDAWEAELADGLVNFSNESKGYIDFMWAYLVLEEREVLPLAVETLNDCDWEEIAEAFAENKDPRFDMRQDEQFREGISRLLSGTIANDAH